MTSPGLDEALAVLDHLPGQTAGAPSCCVYAHTTIRSALTSAAQEAAAWREIEAWCGAFDSGRWVHMTQVCGNRLLNLYEGAHHGQSPECVAYFTKATRLAALVAAGEYCRAELAK